MSEKSRVLFHQEVFMPDGVPEVAKRCQEKFNGYRFSSHFLEHIKKQEQGREDRSHTFNQQIVENCLKTIKTSPREAFEVELSNDFEAFGSDNWFVTKYCIRIPYDDYADVVVVIRPHYSCTSGGSPRIVGNLIVTAWMNSNTDHHYTLDGDNYCSREEWFSMIQTKQAGEREKKLP